MPKFEIRKNDNGKFRFVLKGGNGQILLAGSLVSSKQAVLKGIDSVRRNAPVAEVVDLTVTS